MTVQQLFIFYFNCFTWLHFNFTTFDCFNWHINSLIASTSTPSLLQHIPKVNLLTLFIFFQMFPAQISEVFLTKSLPFKVSPSFTPTCGCISCIWLLVSTNTRRDQSPVKARVPISLKLFPPSSRSHVACGKPLGTCSNPRPRQSTRSACS